MKIKRGLHLKVVLTIVAVGMLPLAGGLLWAGLYGKSTLIRASGEKFTELAKQMASHIDFIIDREIHEAQSLALSEELRRSVSLSNAAGSGKQRNEIGSDPSLLGNPASSYLQAYQGLKEDEYEVIFATDRYGRIVASTRPLKQSDYAQEPWWQAAYRDGQGAIFLTDLYRSPGDDSPRIDLALPILDRESKNAIGVLKFVIKDLELGEILQGVRIGTTGHAMLIGEDGRVLICPVRSPEAHQFVRININKDAQAGWSMQENGHDGEQTVVAFSLSSLSRKFSSPWWVVITQERAELFAPIHQAMWAITGFGAVLVGVLIFLGVLAGRRLTRPILALQKGTEVLARGDLGHRLRIRTGDELETLADTINHMAENLQQLAEARLKAERLMALNRLSTVLAHDLRNPMVGILKALALFQETYGKMPESQARQLLSDVIQSGNHLFGTLNDLLDIYCHSHSDLPLRYTDFSLGEAFDEIVRLLDIDAQARGIKLEMKMDQPDLVISLDHRRIRRVIFNLLDNAIKHSPSGGLVTLQVGGPVDGEITFRVEDEGRGIPERELTRIFEFLYQTPGGPTDQAERGGIGVGLYFCRVAVEAHGGRIRAENRPEGGARFTVLLSLQKLECGVGCDP